MSTVYEEFKSTQTVGEIVALMPKASYEEVSKAAKSDKSYLEMSQPKTYRTLEELESDLFQHIHLENNILFKISIITLRRK